MRDCVHVLVLGGLVGEESWLTGHEGVLDSEEAAARACASQASRVWESTGQAGESLSAMMLKGELNATERDAKAKNRDALGGVRR